MTVLKGMVERVGDEAWWLHHVIGPWDMAAEVRGLVDLSTDIYDRPSSSTTSCASAPTG